MTEAVSHLSTDGPAGGCAPADITDPHCYHHASADQNKHRTLLEYQSAGSGFPQSRPEPVAGPVVTQIFRWRAAGRSAAAICRDLDADAIPCPSAHDPGRNRHRTGANWTAGAVL